MVSLPRREAEPWKQTVHETGERAKQHAAAEAEGRAHVLEVGLVDRGGMIGEAAKHEAILGVGAGNGLLTLRHSRLIWRNPFQGTGNGRENDRWIPSTRRYWIACRTTPTWPLAEIARRVGLSTTPCWRRINRLQEAGIIRARVALLERKAVNAGVTVFVAVRTAQHNAQWLGRFAKAVASFPEVMDCYRMSGEIDYLIRLALPDIEAYDAFYKRLIAKIELSDVTSMFAMEEIKSTTRLPLNYLP